MSANLVKGLTAGTVLLIVLAAFGVSRATQLWIGAGLLAPEVALHVAMYVARRRWDRRNNIPYGTP